MLQSNDRPSYLPMNRWSAWLLAAVMLAVPVSSALAKARETAPKATVVFRIAGILTKKSRKGKKVKRVLLPAFVQTPFCQDNVRQI